MIGTNNLGKNSINDIVQGILNIIRIIKQKLPRTEIIVYGLLDKTDISLEKIVNLNRRLQIASLNQVTYLFFGDQVNAEDKYFDGNVHLSPLGYEKWHENINQ